MNLDTKKNLIIANVFFLFLMVAYILLHMGPFNVVVFLIGWILLNISTLVIKQLKRAYPQQREGPFFLYFRPVSDVIYSYAKYVYDQNHILSDSQVERINRLNEKMNKGSRAQRLFLFIYSKNPDTEYKFSNKRYFATEDNRISREIADRISTKESDASVNAVLSGNDKKNAEIMHQGNINVIAYNTSTGKTSFYADSSSYSPLTADIDTFPNRYWHKGFLVFGLHSHIPTLQASAITKFAERQSKPLIEFQRTGHYLYCILYQLTIAILIIWPIIKCLIIVFSGNDTYTDSDADYDNGYLNGLTDFFILNHFFNNRK